MPLQKKLHTIKQPHLIVYELLDRTATYRLSKETTRKLLLIDVLSGLMDWKVKCMMMRRLSLTHKVDQYSSTIMPNSSTLKMVKFLVITQTKPTTKLSHLTPLWAQINIKNLLMAKAHSVVMIIHKTKRRKSL